MLAWIQGPPLFSKSCVPGHTSPQHWGRVAFASPGEGVERPRRLPRLDHPGAPGGAVGRLSRSLVSRQGGEIVGIRVPGSTTRARKRKVFSEGVLKPCEQVTYKASLELEVSLPTLAPSCLRPLGGLSGRAKTLLGLLPALSICAWSPLGRLEGLPRNFARA